jgi:hypothetical protein
MQSWASFSSRRRCDWHAGVEPDSRLRGVPYERIDFAAALGELDVARDVRDIGVDDLVNTICG